MYDGPTIQPRLVLELVKRPHLWWCICFAPTRLIRSTGSTDFLVAVWINATFVGLRWSQPWCLGSFLEDLDLCHGFIGWTVVCFFCRSVCGGRCLANTNHVFEGCLFLMKGWKIFVGTLIFVLKKPDVKKEKSSWLIQMMLFQSHWHEMREGWYSQWWCSFLTPCWPKKHHQKKITGAYLHQPACCLVHCGWGASHHVGKIWNKLMKRWNLKHSRVRTWPKKKSEIHLNHCMLMNFGDWNKSAFLKTFYTIMTPVRFSANVPSLFCLKTHTHKKTTTVFR